jgi:uncharacterized short protein YbdD (DUF466 family)
MRPEDRAPPPAWEFQRGLWVRAQARLRACLSDFRRVVGMPDYAAYLQHLQEAHPGWPVPTEREFFELYLRARYGDGPTRCC